MDKTRAISEVNNKHNANLTSTCAHFSNVNKSKPVWWFDIPLSRLLECSIINLLLFHERTNRVFFMEIPSEYLETNINSLRVRKDKKVISLELSTANFQDVIGPGRIGFRQFIKKEE